MIRNKLLLDLLHNEGLQNITDLEIVEAIEGNTALVVDNGVLYNSDKTILMLVPAARDYSAAPFVVPATVQSIEDYAFQNFKGTQVVLPSGLITIDNFAFYYADKITSIDIPASVTTIGNSAFEIAMKLETISFAAGSQLTTIGSKAFAAYALKSIEIPDTVTSMGTDMFTGIVNLTYPDLPSGITSLPSGTFNGCTGLATVKMYDGITSIGQNAFNGCSALTSVSIPASVTEIGTAAFSGCRALASVEVKANSQLASIQNNAFANSGITSITLPETVTFIGTGVFSGCSKLESAVVNATVTTLPANIFKGLTTLTSVKLAKDVQNANTKNAYPVYFRGCKSFIVNGEEYLVGTSYGRADKIKQIYKMINLCSAPNDFFVLDVVFSDAILLDTASLLA